MLGNLDMGTTVLKWNEAGVAPLDQLRAKGEKVRGEGEEDRGNGEEDRGNGEEGKAKREEVGARGIGPVTFVLSTDDVDRHGDVVLANGWRLDAYLRNPVLLWAHDYHHPAIGRAVSLWTEPHRLLAKVEFAPSAFAQEVAALYAHGFQWGVSVGFRPIRWEERRDPRTGAYLGLRYLEQELLEVSAVPVPANREALRRRAEAGDEGLEVSGVAGTPEGGITWSDVAMGALLSALEGVRLNCDSFD